MNKKEEAHLQRHIDVIERLEADILKLEIKYNFSLDMLIAFGKLAGVENSKDKLNERFEKLLDNFDIDEENEVLVNKKLRH